MDLTSCGGGADRAIRAYEAPPPGHRHPAECLPELLLAPEHGFLSLSSGRVALSEGLIELRRGPQQAIPHCQPKIIHNHGRPNDQQPTITRPSVTSTIHPES